MASRHEKLRSSLTSAIVDLCRKEAFYFQELRIEGTVCLVSDRSSVLITQITEQIGEQQNVDEHTEHKRQLPVLNSDQANEALRKRPRQASSDSLLKETEDLDGKKRRIDEQSETSTDCGDEHNESFEQAKEENTSPVGSNSIYRCSLCPETFTSVPSLQEHMCLHTAHRPYKCHQCEASFSEFDNLCTHIRDDHAPEPAATPDKAAERDVGPVYCTICHEKFEGETEVVEHYVAQHNRTGVLPTNIQTLYTREAQMPAPSSGGHHKGPILGTALVKQEPTDRNEDAAVQGHDKMNGQQQHMMAGGDVGPEGVSNIMQNFMRMLESQQQPNMHPEQMHQARQMVANDAARMQANPNAMFPRWDGEGPLPPVSVAFSAAAATPSQPDNTMTGAHSLRRPVDVNVEYQRSPSGKFQCPYCEKTYSFKHTLKDHINKHTGSRPHVCKHCGDSFTHLASLCAHIKRRHDNYMPNDYKCDICQEKFMNLQSLKQHFTWRHREVKFDIMPTTMAGNMPAAKDGPEDSGKQSIDSSQMNPIAVTSNQGNPAGWENMNNYMAQNAVAFDSMGNYQMRNNEVGLSQSPQVVADQAGIPGDKSAASGRMPQDVRSNYTEDNLEETPPGLIIAEYFTEMNMQTDHGLYKYKCKLCGNMFKFRGSLYEHVNTHLGKRPFVCTLCGDSFAHHSSLHNHTRNKHSEQSPEQKEALLRHPCLACPKKFRFRSELERHFRSNPEHNLDNSPIPIEPAGMENEAPEVVPVPQMLIGPDQVPFPMHQV